MESILCECYTFAEFQFQGLFLIRPVHHSHIGESPSSTPEKTSRSSRASSVLPFSRFPFLNNIDILTNRGVKATYAPVPKQDGNPLITIAKIVPLVTLSVLVVYYLTYHDFFSILDTNRTLAVIIVGTVLILAVSHLLKNSTGDPYGLFHLSLNRLPGEIPDAPPRTEWLNMGFWKVSFTSILG